MSDVLSALQAAEAARLDELANLAKRQEAQAEADRAARQAAYDALSPKEKHDLEVAAHRRWIANPKTASYYWLAIKDGVVVAQEWDDKCDCDDRAEHDASGHTLKKDAWPEAPWTLAAHPIASGAQVLPSAIELAKNGHVFEIGVGDEPIWEHRVRWHHFLDDTPDAEEDALVFGVRHADGSEEVSTVDHQGEVVRHPSHDAALAHVPVR